MSTSNKKRVFKFGKRYTEQQLISAVAAVKNKLMTFQQASETFGVPKTTIADRVSGRLSISQNRPGKSQERFNLF